MNRNKKDVSVIIAEIVNAAEDGLSSGDIHHALKRRLRDKVPGYSTLQRKLSSLVNKGAIKRTGRSRAIRYWRAADTTPKHDVAADVPPAIPVSGDSKAIQEYVRRPLQGRDPVGYHRDFLEDYVPNWTYYLPEDIRAHLRNIGTLKEPGQSAGGTYPPVLVNRLLIDLSWASSRLEGNTYSLLETRNLIEAGQVGRRERPDRDNHDPEPQGGNSNVAGSRAGYRLQHVHVPEPARHIVKEFAGRPE